MAALTENPTRSGATREFGETLRRFLSSEAPSTHVRRWMESEDGFDRDLWRTMTHELGLPGVGIAESLGGQGFGFAETALILEELGRALTPTPFLSTAVLAGGTLRHMPEGPDRDAILTAIAGGSVVTLAWSEPDDAVATLPRTSLGGTGQAATVTGTKTLVLDGATAECILVTAAQSDGRVALVAVDPEGPGIQRRRVKTLDQTRRLAVIDLREAPAILIGADAGAALARARAEAVVAVCADSVGGLAAVVEMAVAYAKERTQFARPIGSFQAIKHKLADLWILFEGSRTATDEAIAAVTSENEETALLASVAKSWVSDAYRRAALDNILVHGGIGFTWEVDAHLHLRRAQFNAAFLGDVGHHRERIAQALEVQTR